MATSAEERLIALFPGLATAEWAITGPPDPIYNCIAWALGHSGETWHWRYWDRGWSVWPRRLPRNDRLETWVELFRTQGFALVEPAHPSATLAVFAHAHIATHVARRVTEDRWTSRVGASERIEHPLHALEGDEYGRVAVWLAPRPT